MAQTDRIAGLCAILERQGSLKRADARDLKKMFAQYPEMTFEHFLLQEGFVEKKDLLDALQEYYHVT
jgi:hypothetical protein